MTDSVHKEIDAFYSERVQCCGGAPAPCDAAPLAQEYDRSAIPDALMQTSFGCGDPLAFAAVQPGDTVVDLGCGAGLDLLLAAERVGPTGHVIGVDMSDTMLNKAHEHLARAPAQERDRISMRQGLIEDLPVDAASVDWVISNCVINLSADKPSVFREIHRILRPGGQFLISDLVADGLPDWLGDHADLYAACVTGAVPEAQYPMLAQETGLQDVSLVDRMIYDAQMVRGLVESELPVALDSLSERLGISREALLDRVAAELSGKVSSIKLYGRKAVRRAV